MANTYKLLSSTVLSATTTTVTFSSLPTGYTDLVLRVSARSDSGSAQDAIRYTVNNDSSASYTFKVGYGNGVSAIATGETGYTVAGRYFYANVGAASTANTFGNGELYISSYNSQQYKGISEDGRNENNAAAANLNMSALVWTKTEAINRIDLTCWNGTDFVAGSSFYLYGVWRGAGTTLPSTPTIGTAVNGTTGTDVAVAFTSTSSAGVDASYTALSTPGSITATGTSSPVTVSGLTTGTAYTFQVRANNPGGSSAYSAASNSVTPIVPTSYESIASLNGTGSNTSWTFTSIPSTYKHLQIRGIIRETSGGSTNGGLALQFNSSGNSLGRSHWLQAYGATNNNYNSGYDSGDMYIQYVSVGSATIANVYGHFIIDILDYSDSSKNKVIRNFYGVNANNNAASTQVIGSNSNLWINTSVINAIRLVGQNGNPYTTLSNVALYGIKES